MTIQLNSKGRNRFLPAFMHVLLLGALGIGLWGCGEDQEPETATAFWNQIQADDYRSWQRAPGYETRQPSRSAHGDEVEIFINDVVVTALADPMTSSLPIGSIIVKDGFEGGDLSFVAGMEKRGAFEWFWVEYNGDGDTIFSGAPTICTGCHQIGDDWVRGFFLPN